jgi:ParB-like chromosome segregation protein Spo0J
MENDADTSSVVLSTIARYITYILKIFGLMQDVNEGIGFGFVVNNSKFSKSSNTTTTATNVENENTKLLSNSNTNNNSEDESMFATNDVLLMKEQLLTPYLDVLAKFREQVRIASISGDCKSLLLIADDLRDVVLPHLGVRLEDKGTGLTAKTVWKLDDPEVLKKEVQQKLAEKEAKEKQKEKNAKLLLEREERAKISPYEMFKNKTIYNFSLFDEVTGLPTHDEKNELLKDSALKKLKKEQAKQKEIYEKHLSKQVEKLSETFKNYNNNATNTTTVDLK